jgi:ParB family transcriptional regulator, chromosome partitioning protein
LAFEREVSDAIGLRVELKKGSGETGSLKIRFRNFDQLEYIKQRLISGG